VDDADALSAEAQDDDPDSTLNLTRRLARLRDETPALVSGTQSPVDAGEGVLAWTRDDLFVAVNFTADPKPLDADGELVLSSDPARTSAPSELGPSEALILRLR
jgi:alpha-glucosidase